MKNHKLHTVTEAITEAQNDPTIDQRGLFKLLKQKADDIEIDRTDMLISSINEFQNTHSAKSFHYIRNLLFPLLQTISIDVCYTSTEINRDQVASILDGFLIDMLAILDLEGLETEEKIKEYVVTVLENKVHEWIRFTHFINTQSKEDE